MQPKKIQLDRLDLRTTEEIEQDKKAPNSYSNGQTSTRKSADIQSSLPFVHCHVHTFHSILDGCGSIDNYIELAKQYGHPAMAITDHGSMSGTFEFFQKCKAAGIKPILGVEAYVNDNMGDFEEAKYEGGNSHQIILIMNKKGFENANKLMYKSFTEGFYKRGRIKTEWLIEHKEGLFITTACALSHMGKLLFNEKKDRHDRYREAEEYFVKLHTAFGQFMAAEIQFNEIESQKEYNAFIISMADKYKVKLILTNDVHYANPEDVLLQDTLIAINQKSQLATSWKLSARHLFYTNSQDMHDFNIKFGFGYMPALVDTCLKNTLKVADYCNFEFEMGVEKYPRYEPTQDVLDYFGTSDVKFIISKLAFKLLYRKLDEYKKNKVVKIDDAKIKEYCDRLTYEIEVIDQKKMLDYFLVNWEIIKDYREHGFFQGAGRGSACGSLLTWCLGITLIDPIIYELFFERFLNPTRKSLPDLDIDYMTDTDHVIQEFLYKKYGKERVLPVSTFSTFNEKGCLKDVVRAHRGEEHTGFDSEVYQVTKEMPDWKTVKYSLKDWFEQWPDNTECSPLVKKWLKDPVNKLILNQTLKLQGQIRGVGQHAAGIVITPSASWEHLPTNIIPKTKTVVTAFQESDGGGKDLSQIGILKLDCLKLDTLNVIKSAEELVKKNKGIDVQKKIDHINVNDKNIYVELQLGINHGIFQFESHGMGNLIKGMQTSNFEELVAANAIFRPGPLGILAHEEYIKNKFAPDKIEYLHPLLKPILEKTKGVMIFQEQVMFIANKLGGMTLGEGDNLRRYMDKASSIVTKVNDKIELTDKERCDKNYLEFQRCWNMFIEGARKNGIPDDIIDKIQQWMIKYSGYSFNRCLTSNHTVQSKTRGKIRIDSVNVGEEILCFNPIKKEDEYCKVKNKYDNGKKVVYKVILESLETLECTLDHKLLTEEGQVPLSIIIMQDSKVISKSGLKEIVYWHKIGNEETLDLEIDSPFHNFYANDVCVSNSHAVAYSYIAAQTLYLKHYYPTEFYTALLNHPKGSGDKDKQQKWLSATISAAISKGINIAPPSRKSGWEWTMTGDKEISMGFGGLNGFGDIAYVELCDLLSKKNKTLQNITMAEFFEFPFSKFNKKAFEMSVKSGVFDDWSSSREYLYELKQRKKKKTDANQCVLFDLSTLNTDISLTPPGKEVTTEEQKRKDFLEACNFDLVKIKEISETRNMLNEKAGRYIDSVMNFAEDDYYFFILESFKEVISEKGNAYLVLKISDGISEMNLRVFNPTASFIKPQLANGGVYVSEFVKSKGFINFKGKAQFQRVK